MKISIKTVSIIILALGILAVLLLSTHRQEDTQDETASEATSQAEKDAMSRAVLDFKKKNTPETRQALEEIKKTSPHLGVQNQVDLLLASATLAEYMANTSTQTPDLGLQRLHAVYTNTQTSPLQRAYALFFAVRAQNVTGDKAYAKKLREVFGEKTNTQFYGEILALYPLPQVQYRVYRESAEHAFRASVLQKKPLDESTKTLLQTTSEGLTDTSHISAFLEKVDDGEAIISIYLNYAIAENYKNIVLGNKDFTLTESLFARARDLARLKLSANSEMESQIHFLWAMAAMYRGDTVYAKKLTLSLTDNIDKGKTTIGTFFKNVLAEHPKDSIYRVGLERLITIQPALKKYTN